jgi:acetyl-CoA C-acetyltransferase
MIQSLSSAQPAPRWAPSRAISPRRPRSDLGAVAIKAAVERAGVDGKLVEHVYFGNCLMAGQGQAPARQALIKPACRHPPAPSPCPKCAARRCRPRSSRTTSWWPAAPTWCRRRHGVDDQRTLPDAEGARRLPHRPRHDVRPHDATTAWKTPTRATRRPAKAARWAPSPKSASAKYQFTREAQDNFAIESVKRAQAATTKASFKWEIAPVTVASRTGDTVIDKDEGPLKAKVDKIPTLRLRSRRTAPSPPLRRRRSTTAPPRW